MPETSDILWWLGAIVCAYLVGSIPFGILIGRLRGIDIRQHGSRNVGATNVSRVLGRRMGMVCFALDALKGTLPVLGAGLISRLLGKSPSTVVEIEIWLWLAVAAATIVGHMFSIFLGFHGGKGVATGFGAMLGMWPWLTIPAIAAFAMWLIVLVAWKYVSLASMSAAGALPFATGIWLVILAGDVGGGRITVLRDGWPLLATTAFLALVVIWRHRANIARLRRGEEPRIRAARS